MRHPNGRSKPQESHNDTKIPLTLGRRKKTDLPLSVLSTLETAKRKKTNDKNAFPPYSENNSRVLRLAMRSPRMARRAENNENNNEEQ